MEDIIIIGGGIIGSLIAYNCSKYHCNVLLLEKENDIANKSTMANSAIIHAGYDPDDYSLKAEMNIRGARKYPSLCRELKVDFKQIGSLVVAVNEDEVHTLERLHKQAEKRGIRTQMINRDEILVLEENISDDVIKALYCKQTGIVTPWKVAIAAMETAMSNQCKCELNQEVKAITVEKDGFIVKTQDHTYHAKIVINCAGIYADKINEMVTHKKDFKILPRKGEYYVLSKNASNFVKHVIYPAPTKKGKGVLVTPTIHGNILLGPTASEQIDREDNSTSERGLTFVREKVEKIVKNVPYDEIIHSFSGLRASCADNDFIIRESSVKNFINVAAIDSPGLASAPAIAEMVVNDYVLKRLNLSKRMFFAHRVKNVVINECSTDEKERYIAHNPKYGRIICRCEQVSEGEIIDCIRRKCGARSVVAVKKRVRPGMGKCQGGFCEPLVVKILAKELGISPAEVDYNEKGSPILVCESKGVRHEKG